MGPLSEPLPGRPIDLPVPPEPDWREEQVADEVFRRAVEEQRGRVGRLISWLDQCPAAPQRGRGD